MENKIIAELEKRLSCRDEVIEHIKKAKNRMELDSKLEKIKNLIGLGDSKILNLYLKKIKKFNLPG